MQHDIVDYLTSIPCWFLATAEDGTPHAQPHVRPFSFAALDGGRICFCTATDKDVYRELQSNPRFELSGWHPGEGWIVMAGDAIMDIDVASATRIAGYRHMTGLGEMYTGPDDLRLTFFSCRIRVAEFRDIDGNVKTIDCSS